MFGQYISVIEETPEGVSPADFASDPVGSICINETLGLCQFPLIYFTTQWNDY